MEIKNVSIIGGGNSAHAVIPFLSLSGYNVSLLTRHPEKWRENITLEYQTPEGMVIKEFKGELKRITSNPEEIIPDSDLIILCMPVTSYRAALHSISSSIRKDKKVYIMTIYGQGGFDWMVGEIRKKENLNNVVACAVGLIPWVCRTKTYGHTGITYGPKAVNVICVDSKDEFEFLEKTVLSDICYRWFNTGRFVRSENFISLSLSVDNQIIHTTRMFSLYLKHNGVWEKEEDVPYFYKDYDQLSADMLKNLDDDYTSIRKRIKEKYKDKDFRYMMDYLELERFSYNSSNSNILESFKNSVTLRAIATPTVLNKEGKRIFDINHRFFTDDIYYGLCIAKWFAQQMNLNVPTIDRILFWAQELLCVKILDSENRLEIESLTKNKFMTGIPVVYGFSTIDECIS